MVQSEPDICNYSREDVFTALYHGIFMTDCSSGLGNRADRLSNICVDFDRLLQAFSQTWHSFLERLILCVCSHVIVYLLLCERVCSRNSGHEMAVQASLKYIRVLFDVMARKAPQDVIGRWFQVNMVLLMVLFVYLWIIIG